MKKSVILTIIIIYIASIVIVGFIGMKLKVYNQIQYVENITCSSENFISFDSENLSAGDKALKEDGYIGKISTQYVEGLKIQIKCAPVPLNATNAKLTYDASSSDVYTLTIDKDGFGVIEFKKAGTADIIVKSTDTKGKEIKIRVIAIDLGFI